MYKFKFPAVDASSLRLPTPATPVLSFDRVSVTYAHRDRVNPGDPSMYQWSWPHFASLLPSLLYSFLCATGSDKPVLEDVTLQVTLQSRIGECFFVYSVK